MRRTNLRLRKGTVRVRQGRRIGPSSVIFCAARSFLRQPLRRDSAGWYRAAAAVFAVLDGEPAPTLRARPARPRGLPSLRQARRTGHPHPIPPRVSFGCFRWGKASPEEAPEKVWARRGGTMAGGSGAAAPIPHGGRGGAPLFLPPIFLLRAREAVRFLLAPDLPYLSSLLNYFLNSNGYSPGDMTGFKTLITYQ